MYVNHLEPINIMVCMVSAKLEIECKLYARCITMSV